MRLLVLLLLLFTGCRDFAVDLGDDIPGNAFRSFDVEANEPFEMAVGDQAFLVESGVTVTFSLVLEDSRCQRDSFCSVPGRAGILLDVSRAVGDDSQIILQIPGLVPVPYRLNDFVQHREERFQLLQLDPTPVQGRPLGAEPYVATLLID